MSENIENVYIDTISIWETLKLTMENIEKLFYDCHPWSHYYMADYPCCAYADWDSIHGAVDTAAEIVPEFDTVEIKWTPGMWFTLFFINWEKRWGVFVPCYEREYWYYSENLTLVVNLPNWNIKEYRIEDYTQEYKG